MSFSHQQAPQSVLEQLHSTQSKRENPSHRSRNLLLHLSIAPRLVLGFLIPALIAALVAGIIGLQSAQLLSQESDFYQQLFQHYSALTTGNDFLQLMDFKTHATLADALGPNPPQDLLTTDQQSIQQLATRYDTLLGASVQNDLLAQHPDQAALFEQAGHPGQAVQQSLLAHSALRTWNLYRDAQHAVLQEIEQGNDQAAQNLERLQGEPTFSDALSSLRQLIQFDGRLTAFVQDAIAVQERNQLITTLVAAVLVLLAIGVIGRLIYGTLVRRLRRLQRVAQAVQEGQITSRVLVDGRDEITAVSASVNAMLDAIVGLLDETRMQRDALSTAATRLFSDIRLANGVAFDVSAAVNTDPIGMLGNAFHFTIGRFHRFVVHTKRTIEPLEVVAQQEIERARTFLASTRNLVQGLPAASRDPANVTERQIQEIARLAEGYAREALALAHHLRGITQEMRASLAPFRLEAIERSKGFTVLR
ncbi:MAG TPA: HAMP domain-containing protein [Ktedonobacteraceae bacterium]|nr:HAMP domain-containing protein [Ktedonobacteraceae bacterium]